MRCASCQYENQADALFCESCGAKLPATCAACGTDLSAAARFCRKCGTPTQVSTSIAQTAAPGAADSTPAHPAELIAESKGVPIFERRQLSVMFCDLVGSTALSSRLDPEDLRAVVQGYQRVANDVVRRYEGHIAQFLGDGILAYFGYPHAHEDDAVRAAHAGLGILEEIAALSARLAQQSQIQLAVRIGIHSGLVVVGESSIDGSSDRLAIGETPNVAARLQAHASPGTVVVSHVTRQLLGGQFDLIDLGEVDIKGGSAPVHAARVTGVRTAVSRFDAATQSGLTPLVGRAQEVGLLSDRWQLAQEGEGQVILLAGEPGLGKSRLLRELRETLGGNNLQVLRFQCSPYYANSAYYPLTAHLERALGFAPDASTQQKLDALEALTVARLGLPRRHAQLLAMMLSIPTGEHYPVLTTTPQRQKEDTLAAAVDLMLAACRDECALILFEDIHWVDPTTLEFLDLLISRGGAARMLLVLTHRPEFESRWMAHGHVTALALSRLSRTQSAAIVTRLAAGKALPAGLLEQIIAKTDGVPLFVEELTRSLLESDQLRDRGDRYEFAGKSGDLKVPSTLRDSLMARLDRDPLVKEIAQTGAVLGREFPCTLLQAVANLDTGSLQTGLERLVESGLAFRRGAWPDAVFTFKHALVQDAAYDSLVKTRRQALHAAIAETLERESPHARDTQPELLAHHYTAAGAIETAVPLWHQAGAAALARVAAQEAISHLSRGLELLEALPPSPARDAQELDLRILLGAAWMMRNGWWASEVWSAIRPALDLAKSLNRSEALAGTYYNLYANVAMQGRLLEADRWTKEAFSTAASISDSGLRTIAELLATFTSVMSGDWINARVHTENLRRVYVPDVQAYASRAMNYDPGDNVDAYSGHWIWALGYPDKALKAFETYSTKARSSNNPFAIPFVFTTGATVLDFRGDFAALSECAEEAIRIGRENALPIYAELFGPMYLALAVARADGSAESAERLRLAVAAWQAAGANLYVPHMKAALAEVLALRGDLGEALEIVNESLDQIERPGWGERAWLAENLRIKGVILERLGRVNEGQLNLERAITVARDQRAKSWELRAATSLARFWQGQGKRNDAYELLAPIYGWFTEGFDTRDLKEAKSLLEELSCAR